MRHAVLAVLACAACLDNRPSEGECTGPVEGALDPASHFRTEHVGGAEQAVLVLRYAGGALAITGRLAEAPPSSRLEGTHPLFPARDGSELVVAWSVSGLSPENGTLNIDVARPDRLAGSFELLLAGGADAELCTFDLLREGAANGG